MSHSFTALIAYFSIAAALNAASMPINSQEHRTETLDIVLESLEHHSGTRPIFNVAVGLTCVNILETILPTKLRLNTTDPDHYQIVAYKSPDCNRRIEQFQPTRDVIFNDRYPICSFKLNLVESNTFDAGSVVVAFYLKDQVYKKTLRVNDETIHDICNTHSGKHKFAEKVIVFSGNVNGVVLFRETHPANKTNYQPLTVRNETDIVRETLKRAELVRSFKVIQSD